MDMLGETGTCPLRPPPSYSAVHSKRRHSLVMPALVAGIQSNSPQVARSQWEWMAVTSTAMTNGYAWRDWNVSLAPATLLQRRPQQAKAFPRHARTCCGHPIQLCPRRPRSVGLDGRDKHGHDEWICLARLERASCARHPPTAPSTASEGIPSSCPQLPALGLVPRVAGIQSNSPRVARG